MSDLAGNFGLPKYEAYLRQYTDLPNWLNCTLAFLSSYCVIEWAADAMPIGVFNWFWELPAAAPHLRRYRRWAQVDTLAREQLSTLVRLRPAVAESSQPPTRSGYHRF